MTRKQHAALKERFISLLHATEREGIEELLNWLEAQTDFYSAPASTKYHCSYPGGLLEHSLNAYDRLVLRFGEYEGLKPAEKRLNAAEVTQLMNTIAICALLHDICKANFYANDTKNQKIDGEWVKVPFIKVEEKEPMGRHGEKSVILIQDFIKLNRDEKQAIIYHMGDFTDYNTSTVYGENLLALYLHIADLEATYIDEAKKEEPLKQDAEVPDANQ